MGAAGRLHRRDADDFQIGLRGCVIAMDLGPHAFFILAAYAATGLIVALLILRAVIDHRAQVKALAELESRGARRRSAGRP
jgi:heme exporter protein D